MPRISRRLHFTLVVGLLVGSNLSVAQEPAKTDPLDNIDRCDAKPDTWWCQYDRQGFIVVGVARDDDRLRAMQLGYGIRGISDESPGWVAVSVSTQSNGEERVSGIRAEMVAQLFARWWGGIGPLFGVGLESRSETSHDGFGGYMSLGAQFTMWTSEHWQFAAGAEHAFGVSSESRNIVHLVIAYAHERLTIGPVHD